MARAFALHFTVISDMKSVLRDMRRFEARIRQTQRQIRFVSTELGTMNRQLTIGLGLMLGLSGMLTKKAVGAAVVFEDAQNALEVFIGDAAIAKSVLSDLMDFAATTPFEIPEVLQGAKTLMALGVSADEVVPKLKVLGEAAFALKKPLDQVTLAWNRLQQGIFTTMTMAPLGFGRKKAREYGIEFGSAGGMQTSGEQAAVAFETYLIDQYGGMFDKAKTMLSGKIANLVDEGIKSFAELGIAMMPIVKEVLDKLIDLVARLGIFVTKNKSVIISALEPVTNTIRVLLDIVISFMDELERNPKILQDLIEKVSTLVKWLFRLLVVSVSLKVLLDTIILIQQLRLQVFYLISGTQKLLIWWARKVKAAGSVNAALVLMRVNALKTLAAFGPWVALLTGLGIVLYSVAKGFRDLADQANAFREEFNTLMDDINASGDEYDRLAGNIRLAIKSGAGDKIVGKTLMDLWEKSPEMIKEMGLSYDKTTDKWKKGLKEVIDLTEIHTLAYKTQGDIFAKQQEKAVDLIYATSEASKKALFGATPTQYFWKVIEGQWKTVFNKKPVEEYKNTVDEIDKAFIKGHATLRDKENEINAGRERGIVLLEVAKKAQEDLVTSTGKSSNAQKLYNKYFEMMVELGDKWDAIQVNLRVGLIDSKEAAVRVNKLLTSAADSGINLYTELSRLSPALATFIEKSLSNLITMAKVSSSIKNYMKEQVEKAKEKLSADLDEIEFKNALLNIGADQEQQYLNELDMIDDKLKKLSDVKDVEKEITGLKQDQLLTEKRLADYRVKAIRDLKLKEMLSRFESEQTAMQRGFEIMDIGMDRKSPRAQLEQKRQQVLEEQSMIDKQIGEMTSSSEAMAAGGGQDALDKWKKQREETDHVLDTIEKQMAQLHKDFYAGMRASLHSGIMNLISSLGSGDIGQSIKQFFTQMTSNIQDLIIESMGGLSMASAGVAGLVGLGISLISGAFNKDKSAAFQEVNKVFVVNWPDVSDYTLPMSLLFSGRGGNININISGTTAGENPERTGEMIAQSIQRQMDRGLNLAT